MEKENTTKKILEQVEHVYLDTKGQLVIPQKLYQLLKARGNPRKIIIDGIKKQIAKYTMQP